VCERKIEAVLTNVAPLTHALGFFGRVTETGKESIWPPVSASATLSPIQAYIDGHIRPFVVRG
jgi:hypothetical protein